MRAQIATSLAVVLIGIAGSVQPAAPAPAPAAAPSAAVMFDQIDRTLAGSATPPPPGSFDIELALIKKHQALAKSGQAPSGSQGESITQTLENIAVSEIPIPFVGSWLTSIGSHAQEKKAEQAAAEIRNAMNAGVLTRYAFYNGWTRVEVPGEYAIITRPDLGKKYTLDLQNKVFSTTAFGHAVAGSHGPFAAGSAQVESTASWTLKQPQDIDGQTTAHYDGTAMLLVDQARGVCEDGEVRESVTLYVTDLLEPSPLLGGMESLALPTGCTPALERHSSGDDPSTRFYLYRLVHVETAVSSIEGPVVAISMRSNVKRLGPEDAALFAPPADFSAAR